MAFKMGKHAGNKFLFCFKSLSSTFTKNELLVSCVFLQK